MKKINYKSDFDFILRLADCQSNPVGWPGYDWTARIWTGQKANAYIASCIGGQTLNCYNDGGLIHIVADSHRLSPGILQIEFTADIPNADYPDQAERIVIPLPLEIELIREAAPCPESFEVQFMLPYIKFRYEDLTDEQKAELMQPAVDAANHAEAVLKDAEAVRSNRELAANVEAAAEAERLRQQAEETRISNEELRQRTESKREDAETQREKAETDRVDTEAIRVSSENARVSAESERAKAETARATAENTRVAAESKRVEQENARKEAEESRVSEETKRVEAEAKRVTAENTRKTAEQGRVTAESGRVSAEEARVLAEQKRATEFEGWQGEIDGKADRSELSNVLAVPTENRIEEIEPGIITEALRKVPQVLTPEEQEQVKANIGVSKMELFIDLWRSATYGYWHSVSEPEQCGGVNKVGPWVYDIQLTYEEAIAILALGYPNMAEDQLTNRYAQAKTRTHLPQKNGAASFMGVGRQTFWNSKIEMVVMPNLNADYYCFYNCAAKSILVHTINTFAQMQTRNLISLRLTCSDNTMNAGNYDFRNNALMDRESFTEMIRAINGSDGSSILTVHPDIYTKLTDEANTQWHQVLIDAAEKNINFATV